MSLSKSQIARYSRQLILPEIGVSGQERLLGASVLIIGAGGLGSPAAFYLGAAGIGRIAIMDDDVVALNNLHRQILHTTDRIGTSKTLSAMQSLKALNPEVTVVPIHERLAVDNAIFRVREYDVILDGSDNFTARYLVNDACVIARKSFVYGGVIGFGGQVMVVKPTESACLRCVFPEPPQAGTIPSCQEAGVVGAAAGVIGSLMALETIKLIAGAGGLLVDRLAIFSGHNSQWREVKFKRNTDCAVCGVSPIIRKPIAECQVACSVSSPAAIAA